MNSAGVSRKRSGVCGAQEADTGASPGPAQHWADLMGTQLGLSAEQGHEPRLNAEPVPSRALGNTGQISRLRLAFLCIFKFQNQCDFQEKNEPLKQ